MPIPALNDHGLLPEGVYDCTPAEIRERFGQFQGSDRRCRLFEKLEAFLREAKACGLIKAVIVDGSFVTSKEAPSDVDLVLVVERNHDFSAELRPREYNVVSRRRVRQMFRFDVLVGRDGREDLAEHIEFFSRIRGDASIRKGMLRITL